MVRHTLNIFQLMLQDIESVSDHFWTFCINGLKYVVTSFRCVFVVNVEHMWLKPATLLKTTPPRVFFTFLKLYKWYQIAHHVSCFTYLNLTSWTSLKLASESFFLFFLKKKLYYSPYFGAVSAEITLVDPFQSFHMLLS